MKLKKILLENIRSYEFQEIEFPDGGTLLSGDIGSGKTSVLLAIEFGLFGLQPGQKGTSLLRNGKDTGRVVIEFEVDEKKIIVERNIKRGKSISQDYCSIDIDGDKREISVTELKNKILELLEYPKEFSKKQNVLYKFTVYTPQEEMKQIILEDPETRINTLRHVFGIDKYKRVLENISVITQKIREEKKVKEGMISNLEQDKSLVVVKEKELELKQKSLIPLEEEFLLKRAKREKIGVEKEDISKKIEQKNRLQQEVEKTKLMISSKRDSVLINSKLIDELKHQIEEIQKLKVDESKITDLQKQIEELRKEKNVLSEENLKISSKIQSLTYKNEELTNLKNKISKLEFCPTCLQDVGPVHKSNVSNKFDVDFSDNKKQIESLIIEKSELTKKLIDTESKILFSQKSLEDLRISKIRYEGIYEKKKRLEDLEKFVDSAKKDSLLLEQHIKTLQDSVFELSRFENLYTEKMNEYDLASREERIFDIKVAELKKEVEVFSRQIKELKDRVMKTEKVKEQFAYISELEDWINKKFIPVITNIEKNVMVTLKSEFSKLFSEWFAMLVSDSFNVKLDDDFTPVIEQQDYEIDYAHLSGGERTAIALAYRLALNQVINSLMSKIKTRDFMILDEPTDGFSEQQLDKMRNVLEELNVKQMIIVSHEQKIEGFVDNVIRFKKNNGVSGREI